MEREMKENGKKIEGKKKKDGWERGRKEDMIEGKVNMSSRTRKGVKIQKEQRK